MVGKRTTLWGTLLANSWHKSISPVKSIWLLKTGLEVLVWDVLDIYAEADLPSQAPAFLWTHPHSVSNDVLANLIHGVTSALAVVPSDYTYVDRFCCVSLTCELCNWGVSGYLRRSQSVIL